MQMVFQNPDSALNRSWTVRRILKRTVVKLTGVKGKDADRRVTELAEAMRLSPRHLDMRPRQLSGGLKQRVAIARAFAGDPRIVVCDEPTSALDVSVQAAILNLLANLQNEERTSYLFISHDIGVVRYLADRIAVMYLGRIMELGRHRPDLPRRAPPVHRGAAVGGALGRRRDREPHPAGRRDPVAGQPAVGLCVPHRCHRVIEGLCDVVEPEMIELEPGHLSKCHLTVEQLSQPVEIRGERLATLAD
jgi:peptide/nickel transport system ATP-binding protein